MLRASNAAATSIIVGGVALLLSGCAEPRPAPDGWAGFCVLEADSPKLGRHIAQAVLVENSNDLQFDLVMKKDIIGMQMPSGVKLIKNGWHTQWIGKRSPGPGPNRSFNCDSLNKKLCGQATCPGRG